MSLNETFSFMLEHPKNTVRFCVRKTSIHSRSRSGRNEKLHEHRMQKQPGFPLCSGKAACRRLAHTGSLLDYGKFRYGENAM